MILKEIPGTQGFLASDDGKIFDSMGQERNYYRNNDGYKTASVLLIDGNYVTFGVHRLVALAHIFPKGKDIEQLTVNHKDKILDNNSVNNLEWITIEWNNIHAALFDTGNQYPRIIAEDSLGKKHLMMNLPEAAEMIGATIDDVWDAIKSNSRINSWLLQPRGSKDPLPEELRKNPMINRGHTPRLIEKPVKSMDLITGEVVFYDSISQMGRMYNTSGSHIHQCMYRGAGIRLFRKRFLVVYANEEFLNCDREFFNKAMERGSKDVAAYNLKTRIMYFYDSASDFIKKQNLSKKAVTVRLKQQKLTEVSGWLFTYLTDSNYKLLSGIAGNPVL